MSGNAHKYKGINLIGKRHERLVVIKKAEKGFTRWVCKCDCGNEVELLASKFFSNKSCGCLEKENKMDLAKHTRTHGMTKSILYHKYCGMKERCFNPNYKHFERYGGRGITICEEWLGENGFVNFMKWAYKNGYDDNKHGYDQSIDRINVDGNYEPSNCKWSNQIEQARNRGNSIKIVDAEKEISMCEFMENHGITSDAYVRRHIEKGFTAEQIIHDWNILYNTPDNYLTVKEASIHYNCSEQTIYKLINDNKLSAEKVGQKWYIIL